MQPRYTVWVDYDDSMTSMDMPHGMDTEDLEYAKWFRDQIRNTAREEGWQGARRVFIMVDDWEMV
jgi:hypothetical protein